ncbi:MAG: helix-turn-helix domain-containing protein [Candidatus Omnitrophica bacterium]|nr:helix-turn-helix domain-containing protein [Candidatus Omnitrophota bacterium]
MPESLGKILKKIRESKHLSLEEVSERSRIPKHIVSTMEEDRLSEIKSTFYAKSFVRTYAIFLDAMNEVGVKEYLSKEAAGQQQVLQKKQETVSRPSVNATQSKQIDFSIITKYKRQILAIIIGIIVLWFLFFVIGQACRFIKNIPKTKQNKRAVVKKEAPKKTEKEKPKEPVKEIRKEAVSEKTEFIELEVTASENTWLQVTGDGELMFKGSFKKSNKDIWKAKKEIKLEMGNSGVIKINMNGKPLGFTGKKDEKKEIIITKDGIK